MYIIILFFTLFFIDARTKTQNELINDHYAQVEELTLEISGLRDSISSKFIYLAENQVDTYCQVRAYDGSCVLSEGVCTESQVNLKFLKNQCKVPTCSKEAKVIKDLCKELKN